MKEVIVLRHGNTFDAGDVICRVGRGTDLPLSKSGQAQADALAKHFAERTFDAVISSPLLRTRQTAETIARPVQFDDRLLEIDYGPDEGQPEDDVIARIGEDALKAWDEDAVPPPDWSVDPDQIRSDWRDILSEVSGTTLIVTSNGIARFLLDIADHDGVDRKLKTGAYGRLVNDGSGWIITKWNVRPPAT